MIITWNTTVRPLTGHQRRKVYVYVPDEAQEHPDWRFPVLYMFDGHNVFFDSDATYGKSWGMKEFLEETGTPLIVAAVECDHNPPNGRLCEYSPYDFTDDTFGEVTGKGDIFMKWLTGTFKPRIDKRFPTLPGREATFLAGSSMGGLMTLYGLTAYNHVFSRGAALSPSVWLVRDRVNGMISKAHVAPDTVIYMDYGQREMGNHKGMRRCFRRTCDALLDKGVLLTSRIVPNGDHCEACWEEQIPFFMNILLYERE